MSSNSDPYLPIEAAIHALLLPDLLFQIVQHLDFHSLLCCQRVCKTWRSVISRSRDARRTLFLEADTAPFDAFRAVEESDINSHNPPAWQLPAQRIISRPEFRAMFNPWVFTHESDPIAPYYDNVSVFGFYRRQQPVWRFTDRISSGRLDFCFTPGELTRFVKESSSNSSCESMYLTQPPVKRVLVEVKGGYMPEEKTDLKRKNGVKVGDILSFVRKTKAVEVMSKREGEIDFTNIDLKFHERFTGIEFMPLRQLVEDGYGNVNVRVLDG